jgi:hypothetical protein
MGCFAAENRRELNLINMATTFIVIQMPTTWPLSH